MCAPKCSEYLLRGLVECGDCNQAGVRRVGCRPMKWVNAERLEAAVWETVAARLDDPEALARAAEEVAGAPAEQGLREELARVNRDLERVTRGRENLLAVLAEGLAGLGDEARRRLEELARREERLTARRKEIEEALHTPRRSGREARELLEAAREIAAGDGLDTQTRREIVRLLVRRIVVSGRGRQGVRVTLHAAVPGIVMEAGKDIAKDV